MARRSVSARQTCTDTRATHVELRTTVGRRDVQRDRLHAHEVLPAGQVLRERESDSRDALRGERDALPTVGDS